MVMVAKGRGLEKGGCLMSVDIQRNYYSLGHLADSINIYFNTY